MNDINGSAALWKSLWDYDPNGLLVVDKAMRIILVNASLCAMFHSTAEELIGTNAVDLLGDVTDFQTAWDHNIVIRGKEKAYPERDLYVRKVIFPIVEEGIVACIMVDLSEEWHVRHATLEQVNSVIDRQMSVAQEIARLLGETTAQTKVSLLKVSRLLEQEPT